MKNELLKQYNETNRTLLNKEKEIKEKIEKLEKKLKKVQNQYYDNRWIDKVANKIAERINEELKTNGFEIYGPFGLDCQTSIYFKDENGEAKYGITLFPTFREDNLDLEYWTGEYYGGYEENSIGHLYRFDEVRSALPDSIDEIIKVLREVK